jgi:hypothetical protein
VVEFPYHVIRFLTKRITTLTVKTDLAAISPTTTARTAFKVAGADLDELIALAQTHIVDLRTILNQIIATHPNSGGDTTNHASLVSLLAELN